MPRKITLKPHFSVAQLKVRYQTTADRVESRRWHLIWLVADQYTLTAAAEAVGFNYDYARDIIRNYNTEGAASVRNRRKPPRPGRRRALLKQPQLEVLRQRLQSPPDDGGLWNGPKVARVIGQMTGREKIWPQRGWDYLKLLKYSCQQPRPRHIKGDSEAQDEFKKNCPLVKPS